METAVPDDLAIVSVDTSILDVPLVRPHRFATTTADCQPLLLVAITTRGGIVGYGEGVVPGGPWWGGESVETMQALIERYMKPVLLGRNVNDVTKVMLDIERVVAKAHFAKAAIEVAMHDAWARALEVPIHVLLGGAFRDSVEVTWALGSATPDAVVDEALERLEARLNFSFKLKMGAMAPREDTQRIAEIAQRLHGKAGVRVDINARWDRLTALRHLPQLAEAGVELVEQPTPADQLDVLAEINARLPIPVMADESVQTPHDAIAMVTRSAADVVAVKITKCAGLQRSRQIAAIAGAAGIACHAATSIEGPIGTAAALHFACSEPAVNFGSELFGPQLMNAELLEEPLRYADGRVFLPAGPGLGVKLNSDAVKAWSR